MQGAYGKLRAHNPVKRQGSLFYANTHISLLLNCGTILYENSIVLYSTYLKATYLHNIKSYLFRLSLKAEQPKWQITFLKHTWNKTGSWGMTATEDRRSKRPILPTSTPSIKIMPSSSSVRRKSAPNNDVFPAPVRPTMPTFWPGRTSNVRPFKTCKREQWDLER